MMPKAKNHFWSPSSMLYQMGHLQVTPYTENYCKNNYQLSTVNKTLTGQWTMSHILQVGSDPNLFTR